MISFSPNHCMLRFVTSNDMFMFRIILLFIIVIVYGYGRVFLSKLDHLD